MKPNSGKPYERQSVTEAMKLWQGAEKTDKAVGVDQQKNITVLYGSALDRFSKPSTHHGAAKQCLLDKIKTESGPFLGIKNDVFTQVMKASLPSIERFVNDGKLGNLPAEWQAFQNSQKPSSQLPHEIELKRHAHAKKIAELLPADMPIDIRDNNVSSFTRQFSEASNDRLMMAIRLTAHEGQNKSLPLSDQFIKDANRGDIYRIQTSSSLVVKDEAAPSFINSSVKQKLISSPILTQRGAEVVGNLYDFCEGDLVMMATLSCMLCQSSMNKMDDENAREMAGPDEYLPILNAKSLSTSTLKIYELSRDKNGDVITGLKLLTKASMLASGLPDEEWPMKPGPDSEIAKENNFKRRTSMVMAMKPSDLINGEILPTITKPPETTYVFDFDWKRIDKFKS